MTGFTKLFSSITTSSIWAEDDKVRIVWITMLALCEADGIVRASVGGLAHAARVSREDCERALEILSSPDPDSRSIADEGRRITRVDGGFTVNNHAKYREARSHDERTSYMREYMRKRRAAKGKANSKQPVNLPLKKLAVLAKAEAEAEAEAEADSTTAKAVVGRIAPRSPQLPDSDWLKSFESDPAYTGLNIAVEFGKMSRWCETNGKLPSRKRFVNWLNRAEKPMAGVRTGKHAAYDASTATNGLTPDQIGKF